MRVAQPKAQRDALPFVTPVSFVVRRQNPVAESTVTSGETNCNNGVTPIAITVVCTVHNEIGLCNRDQLLEIIRTVGPDVIFEEMRFEDSAARYRDRFHYTLEMNAITEYKESKRSANHLLSVTDRAG